MIIIGVIALVAFIFGVGSYVGARFRQPAIDAVNLVAREAEANIVKRAEMQKLDIDAATKADIAKSKTDKELEDEINR